MGDQWSFALFSLEWGVQGGDDLSVASGALLNSPMWTYTSGFRGVGASVPPAVGLKGAESRWAQAGLALLVV